jgi:lipoate-protein ligase A
VAETLRVIDFGPSTPLRSQTLWHAIGYGVSAGAPVTLSFARPAAPYVCLGYHRPTDEVDLGYCRANELPVLRRMVGGGPVYLDADQLFFQICLPAAAVPPVRQQALRTLLEPAVAAFRAVGIRAELGEDLEISVDDRKICGHGAGQIDEAVVVCGNLIERFDHDRASRVLSVASPAQREQTLALMRRFVAATPVDPVAFKEAMVRAFGAGLGLDAVPGELTGAESAALVRLDQEFTSDNWLSGPRRPVPGDSTRPRACQVKVRAGVWTLGASHDGTEVAAGVVRGTVAEVRLSDRELNGLARQAERAVTGLPVRAVPRVLATFGDAGRRLAAVFAAASPERLL